jgi:bifunctional DNA-binding transcriptional regulator/antitoxin component of YhaV-PrlF toxin-antitoxin module
MKPEQEKRSLAEVHQKIGEDGTITLDAGFMEALGIRPGDWIIFLFENEGVRVKGLQAEKAATSPLQPVSLDVASITQPPLFEAQET